MKKASLVLAILIFALSLQGQIEFIKASNSYGKSKFVGGDESGMTDNNTFSLGVILEYEVAGNMMVDSDHGRWYWGLQYRHLQATSINSIFNGLETHSYDYLEVPVGVQVDWISMLERSFVIGTDIGMFGAVPVSVKGERTGPDAIPWSAEYERPWFILGFSLGGYVGINFSDKVGIKVCRMGQFPFIPIVTPAPEDYTGPEYKPQLLTDGGWQFTVSVRI